MRLARRWQSRRVVNSRPKFTTEQGEPPHQRRLASIRAATLRPVVRFSLIPYSSITANTAATIQLPHAAIKTVHTTPSVQDAHCSLRYARPEMLRTAQIVTGRRQRSLLDSGTPRTKQTSLLAPLAEDLREWFLASGRPAAGTPVFPAHDGGFWSVDDWRNWRVRVWRGQSRAANRRNPAVYLGAAPEGTRPRDLRSSFITLQVYAGVPLTTIGKQCGTSVTMIEKHYAGVIENWDGVRRDPEAQIRAARQPGGRSMDVAFGNTPTSIHQEFPADPE